MAQMTTDENDLWESVLSVRAFLKTYLLLSSAKSFSFT
jgi:hypothetical protein